MSVGSVGRLTDLSIGHFYVDASFIGIIMTCVFLELHYIVDNAILQGLTADEFVCSFFICGCKYAFFKCILTHNNNLF